MEQAIANFRQRMRVATHRLGVPALWRWWITELASLVPSGLRTSAQRRRLRPILAFGPDVAELRVPRITNGKLGFADAARIVLTGDAAATANAGRAAIDSLAQVVYGGAVAPAKVAIVLPREQVLRKTLTLPAVVEDNLLQTLAYDLDRHTPFKADEVYFDAVVIARDPARKQIRVDWAAALKSVVDQARRRAEAWGATVVGVWPQMPDSAASFAVSRLNLLSAAERPDIAGWRSWRILAPTALVLALALVATALPLWQKRSHALALLQLVEQAHVQANASDALRQQLDQIVGDYNFALQRKYSFPSAVQVLDDVTRLLPDDTWLTQLEVRTPPKGKEPRRDMLLRGESGNAGRLVSLLEESKLFGEAAPRSPTTKIQPGPGEIFDLGAQLKPLAAPAPVQLSDLPKIAPRVDAAAAQPTAVAPAAAATNAGAAPNAAAAASAVPATTNAGTAARQAPPGAVQRETEAPTDAAGAPGLSGPPVAGADTPTPATPPGADGVSAAPPAAGVADPPGVAPPAQDAVAAPATAPPPAAAPATSEPERARRGGRSRIRPAPAS